MVAAEIVIVGEKESSIEKSDLCASCQIMSCQSEIFCILSTAYIDRTKTSSILPWGDRDAENFGIQSYLFNSLAVRGKVEAVCPRGV